MDESDDVINRELEEADRTFAAMRNHTACEPTQGYRTHDGQMWLECYPEPDRKPGIAVCTFPGNLLNPPCHQLIAVFESIADRDLVIALHTKYLKEQR